MTEPPRRYIDRQSKPVAPPTAAATDANMDRKARAMLQRALLEVPVANDARDTRSRSTYAVLADHGLLAAVLLCVFVAGFIAGAIWQQHSGF